MSVRKQRKTILYLSVFLPSVASGSIFLVCSLLNINISKKDISTACKISEVTISKCYKELLKYHKYLLPKEILEKLY